MSHQGNIRSLRHEDSQQRAAVSFLIKHVGELVAVSDPGGREENQDAWGVFKTSDGGYAFAVADGLGGHEGGRQASQAAIEGVEKACSEAGFDCFANASLDGIFKEAQAHIRARQKASPALDSMRSTLVVLLVKEQQAVWAHVGDVRLYLISNDKVDVQTKDHSVPQLMVDTGEITAEQIRGHADRSRLLQALGKPDDQFRLAFMNKPRALQSGDVFVLCTDGFWEWITENELVQSLQTSELTLAFQSLENELRDSAVQSDDYDNFTAMAIKVAAVNKQSFLTRLFKRSNNV